MSENSLKSNALAFLRPALREPLVQFALIGLALFVIDRVTMPEAEDPRTIRIDGEVHRDLAQIFHNAEGRLPDEEEMARLARAFKINETLYREARDLQLDHGDDMMRERLIQRMRLMMYSGIDVELPSEEELRAWFEERVDVFSDPATLSFEIYGVDAETEAEAEAVRAAAAAAQAEGNRHRIPGTPLIPMRNRPRDQMLQLFGEEMVAAIEAMEPMVWTVVSTPRGYQVARLVEKSPPVVPTFEEARNAVLGDWRAEALQREARAALDALMRTYSYEEEAYTPETIELATEEGQR